MHRVRPGVKGGTLLHRPRQCHFDALTLELFRRYAAGIREVFHRCLNTLLNKSVVVMSKASRSSADPVKIRAARAPSAQVIDLARVRQERGRTKTEQRVRQVLDENRAALRRLFASGLIFTQKGSRAGRDLLGAQLALLKLLDLLARTDETGTAQQTTEAGVALAQLDTLLARTSQLATRTGAFIGGRGGK